MTLAALKDVDLTTRRPGPIDIPGVTRQDLARAFAEAGYRRGAEIGVEQGVYAEVLCRANPQLEELICVDAWQAYRGYRDHVTQAKLDHFYEVTAARLRAYPARLVRAWSLEAAQQIPDRSLDFVYLDANHGLPWVMDDLCAWVPKVRRGGMVAGHDFCRRKQSGYMCHVVEAVCAYTEAFHVAPWFVLGSKVIKDGIPRDRPRSFVWVVA